MRKVLALTLTVVAAAACRSTTETADPVVPADNSEEMSDTGMGLMDDFGGGDARVEALLENANAFLASGRYDAAENEARRILDIDPTNIDAQRIASEAALLTGRPRAGTVAIGDDLADKYIMRTQQLRADAEDNVQRGQLAMSRNDYDTAIAEFSLALANVRWAEHSVDWQGLDTQAEALLARAKAERDQVADAEMQRMQREALEEIRAQEVQEAGRREAVVATILSQAIDAFDLENFEQSQELAEKALQRDPRNREALEIRDASFRAGRKAVRDDYVRNRKERFARWQEEMDELRIPWTGVITLPDEEYWNEITELRSRRAGLDLDQAESATNNEVRTLLTNSPVPGFIVSEVESLREVISTLRTLTNLPLVVDQLAEEAALDEGVVFDFNFSNSISAERLLNLITKQAGEAVTWTVRHEAILVTTREKARGELVIYNHDVQDLIFGLTEFLGPRIDRLRLLEELEDEDGGGPFGGVGDRPSIIDSEDLITLVQENVAVGTWEEEGVQLTIELGNMIAVHTPDVQKEVRDFLNDLRRFSASLVTIESKFLTVEDNWLQEIGVDFRGIDNDGDPFTDLDDVTNGLEDNSSQGLDNNGTGADSTNAAGPPSAGFFFDDGNDGDFKGHTENFFGSALGSALSTVGGLTTQWSFINDLQFSLILRMTEKSSQVELINDQILSVHNTQRAYVTVINQRAYIQDFDVEVAQFESVADPVINVLTEGIVLDVRPTIHHDRKYLTLEVQPTVAKVVSLTDFSTSLGSQTLPVSFQLPELEVQSVFTTAVVPDGGSILLGGLSRVRNIERRAEVPWLANIPLVGFFFKEEGYNDERQSLMILIRAWITDIKTAVKSLEH